MVGEVDLHGKERKRERKRVAKRKVPGCKVLSRTNVLPMWPPRWLLLETACFQV